MHRILVVDDQLDAARLLITLLKLDGFEADRLMDNWSGFVGEVQERQPDLIILDVRLPNASGLDLVRQLRAHPDTRVSQVPVLMVSALDHQYQAQLAGADGFLLKPYSRDSLLQAIAKIQGESTLA